MATNVYKRMFRPDESERKIALHPFFTALWHLHKGRMTINQFHTLFETDAEDFAAGGDIKLFQDKLSGAINEAALKEAYDEFWQASLFVEWDDADVWGKRGSGAQMLALLDDIIADVNAVGRRGL